ncbi:hypothetical protein [Enterococcus avium]|uniref:hypothetical protein n=1 Tax=Enterococcus avium TaxID=33945 RepID=UPI00288F4809|nr:hypothetical protein [Enterococcus avium]MBS7132774.1 hypothetical protein [Clostridium sp.]MDT2457552.1 hypothetical protein [Enterococcus avium]
MSRKIIAVVNDQTESIVAVLEGHHYYFPFSGVPSKYIEETNRYGEIGEYSMIKIDYFGFARYMSTENYSLVYEEVAE